MENWENLQPYHISTVVKSGTYVSRPSHTLSIVQIWSTKNTQHFLILSLETIIPYIEAGTDMLIHHKVVVKSTKVWWGVQVFLHECIFLVSRLR